MGSWEVRDSSSIALENFDIAWLPSHAYEYVTPRLRRTRSGNTLLQLEAGPFVGSFSLTNGDVLRILPRVGEKAFWRMLLFSEGLTKAMQREFEELTSTGFTDQGSASWHSLLARSFMLQLQTIDKNSLRSERVRVTRRLQSSRGRVKLLPTIVALKKRETYPVWCIFKERTYATAEHRVLAAAARRLLELGSVGTDNRSIAIRWASKLSGRLSEGDLDTVMTMLRLGRYVGPRSYYMAALTMARLLLADAGVAFDEDKAVSTEAVLTNIRTLFERYVRAIVRDTLHDYGFVVEKREDHAHTLFEDGTCALIPDVLISDATGPKLIVDAKYKIDKSVEEPDYYQMSAYLEAYDVPVGVLVMPSTEAGRPVVSRRSVTGTRIQEIRVPLDDWAATESLLAGEVRRLLGVKP